MPPVRPRATSAPGTPRKFKLYGVGDHPLRITPLRFSHATLPELAWPFAKGTWVPRWRNRARLVDQTAGRQQREQPRVPGMVNQALKRQPTSALTNGAENADFPENSSAAARRGAPSKRNRDQDVTDLTDPELPGLNRFSSHRPNSGALIQ
jgi:hypothetical protein